MKNIDRIKLPSNGKLGTPKEVQVRAMKGYELGMLLSSLNDEAVDEVILNVTQHKVDIDKMCDEDKQYILHYARRLTFGDELVQTLRCPNPNCNHIHDHELSYNDLEVAYLEDGQHLAELKLENNDVITKRIPLAKHHEDIKRYKEKHTINKGHIYPLYLTAYIEKVYSAKEDRELTLIAEIVEYLMDLQGTYFVEVIEFLKVEFGLNTTFVAECPKCNLTFTGGIGISADLFRKHNHTIKE